jgi:hypothetical protein
MAPKKYFAVKNQRATLLRKRKYALVRRFRLPENALGGHLSLTQRRCGKPTCRCADGQGHPRWSLDYSFEGKKRVEILPEALALELAPLAVQGREIREAVMELLAINLQLFCLWRVEQRQRAAGKPTAARRAKRATHKHKPRRAKKARQEAKKVRQKPRP